MKITFVGAHQDDEMLCLGTLLKYRHRGDALSLICLTNGDKGLSDRPEAPHEEAARIRDQEMRAVADRLHADYLCLNEPDEALYDTWETRLKLIDALRQTRPDVVFTHFHRDYNRDHTTTSELVFQSAMLSPVASIATEATALANCPAIYYMDPGPGYDFEATHFVEVPPDHAAEMMELISLHVSQQEVLRRAAGTDYCEIVRKRLTAAGERVGVEFAEAFRPCLAARRIPLANMLP